MQHCKETKFQQLYSVHNEAFHVAQVVTIICHGQHGTVDPRKFVSRSTGTRKPLEVTPTSLARRTRKYMPIIYRLLMDTSDIYGKLTYKEAHFYTTLQTTKN